MGLAEIVTQFKTVRDETAAGHYVAAWRATLPIQTGLCDIAENLGFQATGDAATHKEQCVALCKECVAIIDAPKATPPGPVGKLGDGQLLKLLLDLLLKFLV